MTIRPVLRPVPVTETQPRLVRARRRRPLAQAHTFIVEAIRVISATGAVKDVDPRRWAKYGLEVEP